jgi:hypothetical protein
MTWRKRGFMGRRYEGIINGEILCRVYKEGGVWHAEGVTGYWRFPFYRQFASLEAAIRTVEGIYA